jgi:exonuclease SbcC
MIVRKLRLDPFAGISDTEIAFDEALNVIVGPNEAGKSTVAHALRMALTVSTKYMKRRFDKEIDRFLPLAGGDTIRVDLGMTAGGQDYDLTKVWGRRGSESRLRLPGGGMLTDPEAVQERLLDLLGVKEGTFNSVLFTHQAGLSATLKRLSEDDAPSHDLAAILRTAVFETDGVSVDGLQKAVEEEHDKYFSRWDPDLKRPEGGRGIENPYKRGVGRILEAYYDKERLRREADEALKYEVDLDGLNDRISEASGKAEELESFVGSHREAAEDARQRAVLEVKKKAAEREEKDLRQISQKWPALKQEVDTLRESLGKLKLKAEELSKELAKAKEIEANRKKTEIFKRAKKKKDRLDEAERSLSEMKVIEKEDYKSLERLEDDLSTLNTSLEAGKIVLSMTAAKPMRLEVKTDLEDETSLEIGAGESVELSAGGEIGIRHADWAMKVKSGEMDFEDLKRNHERVSRERERLLGRLDAADFAECKALYEKYAEQVGSVERLRTSFEETLEGHAYEMLERLAAAAGAEETARPLATVAREQGEMNGDVARKGRDIESKEKQLGEWDKEYGSPDDLLDLLLEKRSELKDLTNLIDGLKPLPDEFKDAASFVGEFERKERELKDRQGELSDLRIERAELEGRAPRESREEIEVCRRDAVERFERVEREGDAVSEILETLKAVRSSMDDQTMDPWIKKMREVVAPLTVNRYMRVDLDASDGPMALRSDGLEIPFEALSMGTKVGLGLALRLSMAAYFLEGSEGFLLLDDPLVDMDPDRQRAAAEVVRGFAGEKQVVVLTCHPRHAELLGGNPIRMEVRGSE